MPLVSVIIPTHNRYKLLREALQSVKAQTFTDYEIIVVSSNENPEYRALSKLVSDEFGAQFLTINKGYVASARNLGVKHSQGEWLAFLDDDDLWLPTKLEKQLEAADTLGSDAIICDYSQIDHKGEILSIKKRRLNGNSITEAYSDVGGWWYQPSQLLMKTSAFKAVNGFCPWLYIAEDSDLIRKVSWNHKIDLLGQVLTRYRQASSHDQATSSNFNIDFCNFLHLLKMMYDTPKEVRKELPSYWYVADRLRHLISRATGIHLFLKYSGLKKAERTVSRLIKKLKQ